MSQAVAIVGVACEIPSGSQDGNLDYGAFGDFLERGGCSIDKIPDARFPLDGNKVGRGPGQAWTDRASILAGFDTFDHRAFGISTAEARRMTPQTRKLIEVTYRALQDSSVETTTMGVFVGGSQVRQKPLHEPEFSADAHHQTGQCDCMLANRLSFVFDARGPSFNTDTACSASATAMHLACEALARGECESAVVASANHLATVEDHIGFSQLTVLSPDGRCSALSEDANGYVRGEAVVSIVLKPLDAARRDGDRIYGTILGTALNSNGATAAGLTSPSAASLRACVAKAWRSAGLQPRQASYVEMHATGTTVGDRIEGVSLDVFGGASQARATPLVVGSVKSNVGHTEFCAFLVSLVKALHILRRGKTFPQICAQRPSQAIDWDRVQAKIASGEPLGASPLIGITASGFGGSNAHVVVGGPEGAGVEQRTHDIAGGTRQVAARRDPDDREQQLHLFVVSSLTESATSQLCHQLESFQPRRHGFRAMASTLARRARQNPWATYAVGHSIARASKRVGRPMPRAEAPLAFLFPGQGPQHLHMGRALFRRFSAFRESVLRSDGVYRDAVGRSLIDDEGLFGAHRGALWENDSRWSTLHILPALTVVQVGLADLLRSLGLRPQAVLAHSAGETAMAYACGAFGAGDDESWAKAAEVAVRLSVIRAGLMAQTEAEGAGMMAVACSPRRASKLMHALSLSLDIAAINGPEAVTLAGKRHLLAEFRAHAVAQDVQCTMLRTNVAAHSSFMEPLRERLVAQVRALFAAYGLDEDQIRPQAGIDVFSSTVGEGAFHGPFDCEFWWRNTRNVVQFDDCCRALNRCTPGAAVLELSPHPVLGALLEQQASTSACLPALRRAKSTSDEAACLETDTVAFLSMIGELLCRGQRVDLGSFYGHDLPTEEDLPIHTFEKTQLPVQVSKDALAHLRRRRRLCADAPGLAVSADLFPDLAEHTVNSVSCMPAAGFMAAALETIHGCCELRDMRIHVAMPIPAPGEAPSRLTLDRPPGSSSHFSLVSQSVSGMDNFVETRHVDGRYSVQGASLGGGAEDIEAMYSRCPKAVPEHEWLQILDSLVPQLGSNFRRIDGVHVGDDEAIGKVRLPEDRGYLVDPALIDAILHFSIAPCWYPMTAPPNEIYLPKRLVRARFDVGARLTPGDTAYAHVRIRSWSPESVVADCKLLDESGHVVIALDRLLYERNSFAHPSPPDVRLALHWQPVGLAADRPLWEQGDRILEPVAGHADVFRALDTNCLFYIDRAAKELQQRDASAPRHRQRYQEHLRAKSRLARQVVDKVAIPASHAALGDVVERVGPHLAAAAVDELVGVQELFKDDIMTPAYELLGRMDRSFDDAVQSLFRAARAALASGKRTIRVVEAGAGTGQFSRVYGEAWLQRPDALRSVEADFVVTDISPTLSKQALAEMPASLAAKAAVLDLSHPCPAELGSFDVVLMWGVLHVVADVSQAIENVRSLLVPGGYLIVIDLDNEQMALQNPGAITMDTVMGVFKDWYAYDDGRSHCTMQDHEWRARLQACGNFCDVSFAKTRSSYMSHIVITAQAGPLQPAAIQQAWQPTQADEARFHFRQGDEAQLAQWIAEHHDEQQQQQQPRLVVVAADDCPAVWGLTRSGRVEHPHLHITAVMVEAGVQDVPAAIDDALRLAPLEPELLVTSDGSVQVRRLVSIDGPQPWLLGSSAVDVVTVGDEGEQQATFSCARHQASQGNALVHIVQSVRLGAWTLATGHHRGKHVFGIARCTDGAPSAITVPEGELIEVPLGVDVHSIASAILRCIIAAWSASRAKVAAVGKGLPSDFQPSDVQVLSVMKSADPFGEVMDFEPDLVLFFEDTGRLSLHDCRQLCGRVVDFISKEEGNPFRTISLRDAVQQSLLQRCPATPPMSQAPDSPSGKIYRHGWQERTPLFDGDASYLIVGGCCSMGLRLAHFMYTRGARHIVCTSRGGGHAFLQRASTSKRDRFYLGWLEQRSDLCFETPAMDAADDAATRQLCADNDFQGAFFLPLALLDKRLEDLTTADFEHVYRPKVRGLEVLMRHLATDAWLIATSSLSSLPGSQGSANYSAANTWMEDMVAKRPRSVAMLVPSITDAGTFARATAEEKSFSRSRVWVDAACSMDEVLLAMADTLMLLQDRAPSTLFVGRLDLSLLLRFKGATRHLCTHLMNQRILNPHLHGRQESGVSMRSLVAMHLDMEPGEVRDDVALKVYGLDSLSASRLSAAIRKHFSVDVSQLQLLSDANLGRLEGLAATAGNHLPLQDRESRELDADECVVSLNDVTDGHALFILHGGGIGIRQFRHWALGLPFPVFGVRETRLSATFCSADEILQYYAEQIRRVQPQGPYRLAAFCLGALWAPRLVELLKEQAQTVESLIIIDNSPALLLVPPFTRALERSFLRSDNPFDYIFDDVLRQVEKDAEPAFEPALLAQLRSEEAVPWVASFYNAMDRQLRFALRLLYSHGITDRSCFSSDVLAQWLRRALTLPTGQSIPILSISMTKGLLTTRGYRDLDTKTKSDMAMSLVSDNVTALCLDGSHYGAFGNSEAETSDAAKPLIDACIGHLAPLHS